MMKLTEIIVLVFVGFWHLRRTDVSLLIKFVVTWEMCYFTDTEKKKTFYKNPNVWLWYCSLGHTLLMKPAVYNEWKKMSNILNILLPVNSLYKCISSD